MERSFIPPEVFGIQERDGVVENKTKLPDRRLWKVSPNEPAYLRVISSEDPEDVRRFQHIDSDPEVLKWMIGEPMSIEEIKEAIDSHAHKDPEKSISLYGVTGDKQSEIEGWIMLMTEENERVERISTEGGYPVPKDNLVLDLSYARFLDGDTEKERGLMSSAIRQVFFEMDRELSVGIEAMLEKNENIPFPKFTITAYTNPENTSSERVLERCGFERKGKMAYEEGDEEKDDLWVLNWGKLRQIFATRDEMAQQGRDQT